MELATTVSLAVVRGPGPAREGAGRDRRPLGGTTRRRASARARRRGTTRSPASRSRSAGSASTRRSTCFGPCSAGAVPERRGTAVPPDLGSRRGPARDPALGRELGLARRARSRRAGRRRLARLRLQHDARAASPPRARRWRGARGARARAGRLPQRARHDVDLDHGGPRRGRSRPDRRPGSAPSQRDPDELRAQVCVGPPAHCAELLSRYAEAGCERVYLWPLGDERRQIELIAAAVSEQMPGARRAA